MKRILTAMMVGTVSMFFTGCSDGFMEGARIQTEQRMEEAANIAESETSEDMTVKVDYDPEEQKVTVPDYYEYNEQEKYEQLDGEQAFVIKEGHLKENGQIEDIQVLDMVNENTFLYMYTIVNPEGQDEEKAVHCAAVYNFRTKQMEIIHETEFVREGSSMEESFFGQWCRGDTDSDMGLLFVYDNGVGSLYDLNTLTGVPEFQTDIETFMRRYFQKPAFVSVADAASDGAYNIYIELLLEKEGFLEKGEDLAEDDLENDLIQVVMAYEFVPLSANIHLCQDNEKLDDQIARWREMTEGEVLEESPDPAEDWKSVLAEIPNQWGAAYIPEMNSTDVKQWEKDPVYQYEKDGYICTFQTENGKGLKSLIDPRENDDLKDAVLNYGGYDYTLWAHAGSFEDRSPQTISREVEVSAGTDEEGNEITETETQTMTVYRQRQQKLSSVLENGSGERGAAWLEGYRILKNGDDYVDTLYGEVDGDILCQAGGKISWMSPDKDFKESPISFEDGDFISFFQDGDQVRMVKENDRTLTIYDSDGKEETGNSLVISLENLTARYKRGEGDSDKQFENSLEEDLEGSMFEGVDIYIDSLDYGGENIQTVTVSGSSAMDRLKEDWEKDLLGLREGESKNGYLFTSQTQGMSIYIPETQKTFSVDTGSWYRTWKQNGKYIAIGFNNDFAWGSSDMAYARVLEFDVQELLDGAAQEMLESYEETAREEALEESIEASKAAEEDRHLDMEEEWNENYRNRKSGS